MTSSHLNLSDLNVPRQDRPVIALETKRASIPAAPDRGRSSEAPCPAATLVWLSETVDVPEGDAKRPLSAASLEAKFMNAAKPVLGASRNSDVLEMVNRLDTLTELILFARSLRTA